MEFDLLSLPNHLLFNPLHKLERFYNWCNSFADPRNKNWFLMTSPFPTLFLVSAYLMTVKYGPKIMKDKQPLNLKWLLIIYNFGVTLLNGWMAVELLYCGLKINYNFICQLVDTSYNEYELRIAVAIWWYYFSKCIEFLDTIFFILRKKQNQLTFLHVYHHSTMFVFWWVGAKFVPGGSALTGAMVNCFVHVVMYSYYGLAACGPLISKYLWWKKYLTILQLIQFTTGVVLGLNAIITNCQFTRWMQYVFVAYAFSFIVLFGNFYRHAYIGKKSAKETKLNDNSITNGWHKTDGQNGYSNTNQEVEGLVTNNCVSHLKQQ